MYSIPRSRLGALLAATALALTVNGTAAPLAHADSYYCWASQCTGQDPYAQKCIDGKIIQRAEIPGYEVDDMYSAGCKANWAQVRTKTAEPFEVYNLNGDRQPYKSTAGLLSWSNMVDGSYLSVVCVKVPGYGDNDYDAIWVADDGTNGHSTNYPDSCGVAG